jgi:hypothetical protein
MNPKEDSIQGKRDDFHERQTSRGRSPALALRGIPPDVLAKAMARMNRDGWYSKNALIIELLRDYGNGTITPAAAPPPFDPSRRRQDGGDR